MISAIAELYGKYCWRPDHLESIWDCWTAVWLGQQMHYYPSSMSGECPSIEPQEWRSALLHWFQWQTPSETYALDGAASAWAMRMAIRMPIMMLDDDFFVWSFCPSSDTWIFCLNSHMMTGDPIQLVFVSPFHKSKPFKAIDSRFICNYATVFYLSLIDFVVKYNFHNWWSPLKFTNNNNNQKKKK